MSDFKETPRLKVTDLKKSFSNKVILHNVNFQLSKGSSLVIIGGSGSGKSVLIKCISGLYALDQGQIEVDGKILTSRRNGADAMQRRNFGFMFQNAALFDSMNLIENVAFGAKHALRMTHKAARNLALEKLSLVGISRRMGNLYPSDISTGLRKVIALARTLTIDPQVVLFDEPTTGLDPLMSKKIDKLILQCIRSQSLTAVTITHDMSSAMRLGDRVAMLYNGTLIWSGKPDNLFKTDNELVRQFTNGYVDGPISFKD
ncbi:MAG: ABC transporter ATP-binding protein [Rhodospirillaceae bacterium]|nr:ABC transporter ATP-binding protein [Rhodospirillaceae bacterium]